MRESTAKNIKFESIDSVLEFKCEKRKEELAELEQTIERVQQQQVSI